MSDQEWDVRSTVGYALLSDKDRAAVIQSPFTRRALAAELPAADLTDYNLGNLAREAQRLADLAELEQEAIFQRGEGRPAKCQAYGCPDDEDMSDEQGYCIDHIPTWSDTQDEGGGYSDQRLALGMDNNDQQEDN